ncbi:hypothetical protein BX666DRAFT_1953147 [Dichotomocladium elegans]|nr:hypothetical protein BX666DRAFT_1953147 [Dichotomocladium elegans]
MARRIFPGMGDAQTASSGRAPLPLPTHETCTQSPRTQQRFVAGNRRCPNVSAAARASRGL